MQIKKLVSDHSHDKYITSPEFSNLAAGLFNARLAQGDLVTKADFDTKLQSLSKRIASNKTKHLFVENELKKLQNFDSSNFRGESHSEEDGTQNYLVVRPMYRYFKRILSVVVVILYIFGNLKDCLMKGLILLLHLLLV